MQVFAYRCCLHKGWELFPLGPSPEPFSFSERKKQIWLKHSESWCLYFNVLSEVRAQSCGAELSNSDGLEWKQTCSTWEREHHLPNTSFLSTEFMFSFWQRLYYSLASRHSMADRGTENSDYCPEYLMDQTFAYKLFNYNVLNTATGIHWKICIQNSRTTATD